MRRPKRSDDRGRRACGRTVQARLALIPALLVSAATPGLAGDLAAAGTAAPSSVASDDFLTRPYLFGDLGRSRLKEQGIDISGGLVNETVGNLSGGTQQTGANAGQASIQALFDLEKLANITGGTFGITLVGRWGDNLAEVANIPALMLMNEVYGRGNIVRLVDFHYNQALFDGAVDIKVGRLAVGADFGFERCDFINLTFCGSVPGNIAGNYIFNWPVSQWGGVLKVHLTDDLTFSAAVYDENQTYLSVQAKWALLPSWPSGSEGALVPLELKWTPTLWNLSGTYKIGGWFDTATADNAVTSINGQPQLISGLPYAQDYGRYGFYVSFIQQLTGNAQGPNPKQGLWSFFNFTYADPRTSTQLYQVAWGLQQHGTFAGRPDDDIGFAIGTTGINPRLATAQAEANWLGLGPGYVQHNEYVLEAYYGFQATGWLNLKASLQYVIDPGGYTSPVNENAWVVGLRTTVAF